MDLLSSFVLSFLLDWLFISAVWEKTSALKVSENKFDAGKCNSKSKYLISK